MSIQEFIPHQYFRTFCHIKNERSFLYEMDVSAILCIRCTAIYSTFLIFLIILGSMRWNGFWDKKQSKSLSFIIMILMVGSSAVQVFVKKEFGESWFTSDELRFVFGALTGFGVFQLAYLSLEKNKTKEYSSLLLSGMTLCLIVFHYFLSERSYWYATVMSLTGLLTLYFLMNYYVLMSFLPKLKKALAYFFVILMVGAEWLFLYHYNT